ncbi:MAG: prepilin peptidase [Nitrososphaerota archaeon]
MLLIASYEDIKTREINDKIWIIFSLIGIIITLFFLDPINLNKNIIYPFYL